MTIPAKARRAFERAREAHAGQDLEQAWPLVQEAAATSPGFAAAAFLKAQVAFESWRPSVALFEQALALDRGNTALVRNFVLALAEEGQAARADALLSGLVGRNPLWLDGHGLLTTLRLTSSHPSPYSSFAEACALNPADQTLRLAWFHRLATARAWEQAETVLAAMAPSAAGVAAAQLFLACETGRAGADPAIFAPFAGHLDAGLALVEVRHALRHDDAARAEAIAARWTPTTHAGQFWPYRDLAWRLLGDPRHAWLTGEGQLVAALDLALGADELAQLAQFVRSLHRLVAPFPEQSVEGGTQTGRNLLLHHDPVIARLRQTLTSAVADWRDGLPPADAAHPLLGRKPADIRFAGSWSVRLAAKGHHRPHVHPHGWASSAFYLALPKPGAAGGSLAIGTPPPELGLPLAPERIIDPAPGRLALFPSTCWHATMPFAGEERLTIAFDIAPHGAAQEQTS